ncbi:MAG: porin, partial [Pseudobdellovibrionaceae bacterium]
MKKFLIATLATATMAASAHAGSLSLDMRADYNSATYTQSEIKDSTKFYFKTGRLDYQGKALENLSYRVRLAFNKAATQGVDTTQMVTEYASIAHKMNDLFTLTVGKFYTEFGGFEGATASPDLYLRSEFYTRTALTGNAPGSMSAYNLGTNDLLYATGVKGTFTLGSQQVHLLATNKSDVAAATGPAAEQNSSMLGVVWKGTFVDNALTFNASYHTMSGPLKDDKHQFMAGGVMWNSAPFMVVADYLVSEFKKDSNGKKDTITSIIAKLAYTGWEQWTPRLEISSSEAKQEIAAARTNKFMGYGAVLEYKPYNDQTFRYHVAYNNITEKPETGSDIKRDEVVVGARLLA